MRTGLTRDYKEQKLAQIQSERRSDEHYDATPTHYYGEFDPIEESHKHVNACSTCSSTNVFCHHDLPTIDQVPGAQNSGTINAWRPKKSHFVACAICGARGRAAKTPWQAILEWNKSRQSIHPAYTDLPLFGLRSLDRSGAQERLTGIRRDLELRAKEAGLRRTLGHTRTNQNHIDRMKAYLAWCIYAQGLVKESVLPRIPVRSPGT